MRPDRKITRRRALQIGAGAMTAPLFVPARLFGDDAPSKKITMGFIGVGWQGGSNLGQFLGLNDCQVVAIADVDDHHRQSAVANVNRHYRNRDCKGYKDFRELLGRHDIDAVCISTPDHWHSIPAIHAANARKDIYCEKPLSKTLNEGIAMVRAVHQNHRIWQTGSWQRSDANFRQGAELVLNGYIGKVKRVEVGLPSGHYNFAGTSGPWNDSDPPAYVDYNFWVGPSAYMPFNHYRFHKNWRWNYDFGGGQLMDWIGHHGDIAHWGLTSAKYGCGVPDDRIGPHTVEATAEFPPHDAVWNTATKFYITCQYPNHVELVISGGHDKIQGGTKWIGEHGWVWVDRGRFNASEPNWIKEIAAREKKGDLEVPLTISPGHWRQFLDCIKSRKPTITPVAVAHRSVTPGHLGYIASVVKRKLRWDPVKEEIIGDQEASKLLGRKFRAPWELSS